MLVSLAVAQFGVCNMSTRVLSVYRWFGVLEGLWIGKGNRTRE